MTPEFLRAVFYRGRKFLLFYEHYYTWNAGKQRGGTSKLICYHLYQRKSKEGSWRLTSSEFSGKRK